MDRRMSTLYEKTQILAVFTSILKLIEMREIVRKKLDYTNWLYIIFILFF
jgi:hypothetical protein